MDTDNTTSTSTRTSSVSKVRVITRVRPLLPQELASWPNDLLRSCVSVSDGDLGPRNDDVSVLLQDPLSSRNECYQLDSFYGEEDDNVGEIFEKEVRPLIPGLFRGFNATVFAYGATGSGKTYTMQGTDEFPGLMPLAMCTILSICGSTGTTAGISYYEVYLDRCYDLLEVKAKEIAILDDKDGQINLKGLSRVPIKSMPEFKEVLSCGIQRRKTAHTDLNDVSSRSHGVLVISISGQSCDGSEAGIIGKLNLIDLAGSEDNKRSGNEGIRLIESTKINQSLFALSNVIYALNNNKPRVPYRETKLTRILQDSLGGNNRALMVACLNPREYQESVHTVSLAARSRHIPNNVSSTQKLETPNNKVNMEAKLRSWLESKGKTKSLQRIEAHCSPFPGSVKRLDYSGSAKPKVDTNRGASNAKERRKAVPCRNLNEEGLLDSLLDDLRLGVEKHREESTETASQSRTNLLIKQSDKAEGEKFVDLNDIIVSSPATDKKSAMQIPRRDALSPINLNIDQKWSVPAEPKTPKTPFDVQTGTPLNKLHAIGSNLKNSLIQEFIGFLNNAGREELIEIRGIGSNIADCVIELRETSPIKSLSDLEKIGLSSKQVHNLFNKAATGIF